MRGARCKALKAAFKERFNRSPRHMVVGEPQADGRIPYVPSEWRR